MKINRKNIIIAVVVIFFLIGIIPKIARYITTSLMQKKLSMLHLLRNLKFLTEQTRWNFPVN